MASRLVTATSQAGLVEIQASQLRAWLVLAWAVILELASQAGLFSDFSTQFLRAKYQFCTFSICERKLSHTLIPVNYNIFLF